jgi:hypothetical protein
MKSLQSRLLAAAVTLAMVAAPAWPQQSDDWTKDLKKPDAPQGENVAGRAVAVDASRCDNPQAFESAGRFKQVKIGQKTWSFWALHQGGSLLCLFGDKFLFGGGVLAKIEETAADLKVYLVGIDGGAPAALQYAPFNNISTDGKISVPGENEARTVQNVYVHSLPKDIMSLPPGHTRMEMFDAHAWLSEVYGGGASRDFKLRNSVTLYSDRDGAARAARLDTLLASIDSSQSGIFGGAGNADNRRTLKKFLDDSIAKDKPASSPRAQALVVLNADMKQVETEAGQQVVVYSPTTGSPSSLYFYTPLNGQARLGTK